MDNHNKELVISQLCITIVTTVQESGKERKGEGDWTEEGGVAP